MRRIHAALVLVALLAGNAPAQQIDSGSWPHWRGPNRDAVSTESGWSVEGAAEPLWRLNVGLGYSCLSIEGGLLYTMGFDEETEVDRLFCLDATTGEERWRHEWPSKALANFHGGGTLTTPSIDGDRVWVANRLGLGMCLERASGELLWQHDYAAELELEMTFYGFSASPTLIDGALFLVFGDVLVRCDMDTGEVVWRAGSPADGGYSNLTPFELDGRALFAMYASSGLVVYDRESGEEVWRFAWKADGGGVNCCTPIVVGDRVFISSAYDMGSAFVRLASGAEPELVWMNKLFRNKVSSCVLFEDHIYGFDESMLKCIDLEGAEKWHVRGLGMGTPAIADGKLLVLSSKGDLIVAEASPEGFEPLSRRRVLEHGVYWTPPVLLDGLLYCRNSLGDLICLDHRAESAAPAATSVADLRLDDAPPAEALFTRHAALVGGETLRARKSVHIEGEVEILGDGITRTPMHIRRMVPDLWHLQFSLGRFGEVQRGFDGRVGWVLDPFLGNGLVEGAALLEMKETLHFGHGVDWRREYASMAPPVRARFDGRECWEIATTTVGGTARRVYFEIESGLLAGRDSATESLVFHSDWRDFDGVKLPARTVRLAPDTGTEETYFISKATWDSVDVGAFEYPADVLKLLRSPEEIEADGQRLAEAYGDYLGSYQSEGGSIWKLFIDDGELKIDAGDQGTFPLAEPDAEGRFALPFPDTSVTFREDDDGAVTGMVIHSPRGDRERLRVDDDG